MVTDTGTAAKNPASARPIVYAVAVTNLILDKLRTLKMNTDVLSVAEVSAKLASKTITARVVDWSGVAVKMLTPVVEETAAGGLFFEHSVDYAFGAVDSLSVECPPTEAGKTTSIQDPIFSWDDGVPGLLPDVRYCYVRSLDSLGNVVVPSLASADTFNMVLFEASKKTLPPPTKVERGLPNTFDWHTATLTNQVFDDETFYLRSIENVLRPWPVVPTGTLPPYTAARTPLTRIGLASENWGQDSATFHYKTKAALVSRPLLSYSRADASSVFECELHSGSVKDPYLEGLYANTKKVGETPKFLLLPGVLLRCTITTSLSGKVVPALLEDITVRVETGDAKFVTISAPLAKTANAPVQKVGFTNPALDPVTSPVVGNVFEFEFGMKTTAFDGEAEVSAKASELVIEYTPRRLQALAASARANRVNYDKNGPYSSNPNAAKANPFDPLPLLTLAQLDSVDAVAAATSLRKPLVLGSYVVPVAKVFNEQTEITTSFVTSSPKFTLSAVIGGKGTQSTAFKAAAKTYSWSCIDPGTAAPIKSGAGKTLELDAVPGGLICALTVTWQGSAAPSGGVPTFLPLTGTATTTVTITTNAFDVAGTVGARLQGTTDPLGGTVAVSNALTQQVFVQCTGTWSDSNGGLTYELRQQDGVGGWKVLPAQQSIPTSKRFVLSLPLSSVDVELKVTCLARDALGAVGTSTNHVVLRVLALVVPSTEASQNAAVKKIYGDSLTVEKTSQQLLNDLAFLALLTKADPSSVLIASTSLFREIVEAVPSLNKNSPVALQQLLVGGAFSFNAILQAIVCASAPPRHNHTPPHGQQNLDQVHASEREDALLLLSAVLASMTPGISLSAEDTNRLMQVLDDTANLMVKELATTSTARHASTQGMFSKCVRTSLGGDIEPVCVSLPTIHDPPSQ